MAESKDARYEEARRRFQELDVEEQASFLIEATASTLAHGVLQVGEVLADGLEDVIRQARRGTSSPGAGHGPGAAEPETAQQRRPRSGADADSA